VAATDEAVAAVAALLCDGAAATVLEEASENDEVFVGIEDDDPPLPHAETRAAASMMPATERTRELMARMAGAS
jgi:3-oxoacyl-[acyl-carrier-protein] synthase III